MHRLVLIISVLLCAACATPSLDFTEVTIAELQERMNSDQLTAEEVVQWHLDRIDSLDRAGPALNAVIEVNPDAITIARRLDDERRMSGPRGPLHGVPVILKANIDTADRMRTTAGSLALADHVPPGDAFIVARLRDAGALVLAKANLSEWANFRSSRSSSGWSSIGGQTKNPYDTARNPCGSSSGSAVAVAANLTVVAVGTETDGSIMCPSGINGIVGIKPTLGLLSRSGIIPIAHSQDTAGPMARTVRDAAILLDGMTGRDPADATSVAAKPAAESYAAGLAPDALQGKRIGVLRSYYGAGSNPDVESLVAASISALQRAGATVVDGIEIDTTGMGAAEGNVLRYEFKTDLNRYLVQSGAPFETLAEIIEFNKAHADTVMPHFGQERMLESQEKGDLHDAEYLEALAESKRIAREGIDAAFDEHDLDALVAPTNGPAWLTDHINGDSFHIGSSSYAAVSGYPNVTVPAGLVSGLPIGLSFIGRPFGDRMLIRIAYAFEQETNARVPPDF